MTEPTITTFEDLNLDKKILSALKDMGFEEPSPIQKGAIPLALEGDDIIGQAQTGTGKTAASAFPSSNPLMKRIAMSRPWSCPQHGNYASRWQKKSAKLAG